ncbi:MAG TPA: hypothetical protein VJ765_03010 [Chitinophagaceae bacterium]|nr:hypothetical protein [Chitinophagaceae bacterium]
MNPPIRKPLVAIFMTPKILFFFLFLSACLTTTGQTKKATNFINPTGSYKLNSKTTVKNGDTYGYFGDIDTKMLDSSRIGMSFFVCKGAPSYNLGTFIDTLKYENNLAIHRTPEDDTSCRITFTFTKKGITVIQYQADLNSGCAFGHGVFASGFYKKTSSKIPIISDIEDKYNETNGILQKN